MAAPSSTSRLIEARGLSKHYPGFSLKNISFGVDEGEIVGFIGKNGAGKSTTIKALLGLIPLDTGSSALLGHSSKNLSLSSEAKFKENIGVVFDTVSFPPHLSISEIEQIMSRVYTRWDKAQFKKLAQQFGLTNTRHIKDLSRGMGMKLSLACALSHGARLLILDEATAGLDPMARDEVLDILRDFVSEPGCGIFMSSHITSDLERIADRVICIDDGAILFDMPKDAITDTMGIARCRKSELEEIISCGVIPDPQIKYLMRDLGVDVLIPDRYAFTQSMPHIPCDRMTIDDYLAFILKGGAR